VAGDITPVTNPTGPYHSSGRHSTHRAEPLHRRIRQETGKDHTNPPQSRARVQEICASRLRRRVFRGRLGEQFHGLDIGRSVMRHLPRHQSRRARHCPRFEICRTEHKWRIKKDIPPPSTTPTSSIRPVPSHKSITARLKDGRREQHRVAAPRSPTSVSATAGLHFLWGNPAANHAKTWTACPAM